MSMHENGSERPPGCGVDDAPSDATNDPGSDASNEHCRAEDGIDGLAAEIENLESRVVELEAATEALRGYAGSVRSVNRAVERRADRALATAERLRRRIDGEPSDVDLEATHVGTESAGLDGGASTAAGFEPIERPRTDEE